MWRNLEKINVVGRESRNNAGRHSRQGASMIQSGSPSRYIWCGMEGQLFFPSLLFGKKKLLSKAEYQKVRVVKKYETGSRSKVTQIWGFDKGWLQIFNSAPYLMWAGRADAFSFITGIKNDFPIDIKRLKKSNFTYARLSQMLQWTDPLLITQTTTHSPNRNTRRGIGREKKRKEKW